MEGEAGHGLCPGVHGKEKTGSCDSLGQLWVALDSAVTVGLTSAAHD